jgi:hypothetical protein
VEIKFRTPDLLKAMKRLDPEYASLDGTAAKERADALLPIYRQLATAFAALHDTPGVMKAKQVISEIVPWQESRTFFYTALRRRLAEVAIDTALQKANPALSAAERKKTIESFQGDIDVIR